MQSVLVIILSLGMLMLIVKSFIIPPLRKRQLHLHTQTTESLLPISSSAGRLVLASTGNKSIEGMDGKSGSRPWFALPYVWYKRFRIFVSLTFLLLLLLTLFVKSGLADGASHSLGISLKLFGNPSLAYDMNTTSHLSAVNASQRLVRISQLDPNQYNSSDEFNTWAYSACSTASMTEVFDAYGSHLRITDVLQVEARIGEITPSQGLLRPEGIQNTAAQFGFKTTWSNSWTLDQIINIANQGNPVIVSFPPDRYDGGHLLVVTGGNSDLVFLADSSLWNRHSLTRSQFLAWWEGFGAVVTPR